MNFDSKKTGGGSIFLPVAGLNLSLLPLVPFEAFVLSRIDGPMDTSAISVITGMSEDKLLPVLERLASLGALTRKGSISASKDGAHASAQEPEDESVDLDVDRRARIQKTFDALSGLTHYELLEVPHDANSREIRSAYFERSKEFHPDTLFRKKLGSFKGKMETIFKRLTSAYETLTKQELRTEYDAHLIASGRALSKLSPATKTGSGASPRAEIKTERKESVLDDTPTGARRQTPEERRQIAEELLKRRIKPKPSN